MRGLAALAVVIWHQEGYKGEIPYLINTPGRVAVWLFFGISGYCIYYGFSKNQYSLKKEKLTKYYKNRLLRILPLFYFFTILSLGVVLAQSGNIGFKPYEILRQGFAIQWNQKYTLLEIFWTLGIELQFYLVAPFLCSIMTRKNITINIFLGVAYLLMVVSIEYLGKKSTMDQRNLLFAMPHFFAGMIACKVTQSYTIKKSKSIVCLILGIALLLLLNYKYHKAPNFFWSFKSVIIADLIIFFLIAFHCSFEERFKEQSVFKNIYLPFAVLGILSYGIYVWHDFLQKYCGFYSFNLLYLIVCSVFGASITYFLIEKPFLNLKK